MTKAEAGGRLAYLDGLRCLAIVAVIGYHYFYRWTPPEVPVSLYPYGSAWAGFVPFRFGGFGVNLFFVISGFVIAMSLEKCATAGEFFARRYARLAPAMLLCSLLTLATEAAVPGSPFAPHPQHLLSSVLFVPPQLLNKVFATQVFGNVDDVYWSLYYEVNFYLLAALLYFWRPRAFAVSLSVLAFIAVSISLLEIPRIAAPVRLLFMPEHISWFVMGVGFYVWRMRAQARVGQVMVLLGMALMLAVTFKHDSLRTTVATLAIPLLFLFCSSNAAAQRLLGARLPVAIGAASYSLYLLHQNAGIVLMQLWPDYLWHNRAPALLCALLEIAAFAALASLSYRYFEQPASRALVRRLTGRRTAPVAAGPA